MISSDRGASALTVAISMLVLLGVAAIAIDLGAGWNERRQDQTASDLAAVAGALSTGDNDAVADQAMATARINVDATFSDAEWTALWTGCTDPDRPAGFVPINHSSVGLLDCISLNPSFVRVRLPDQLVDTSFGRILGLQVLTTNADAIVTLKRPGGGSGLPFAVRGNAGAGEICLDASTGSKNVEPCDGSESGSFGNLAPPMFGNGDMGTTPECQHQTSANNHVAESIAMGIDHYIHRFSSAQWSTAGWDPDDNTSNNSVDAQAKMDECTDNGGDLAEAADGTPIEAVYVDTGNNTKKDITEGLVTGTNFQDGKDALLTRSDDTRHVDGYDLDNQPLWQHLMVDGATAESGGSVDYDSMGPWAPDDCDPSLFSPLTIDQKDDQMRLCLSEYESGSYNGQIFDDSIADSPRLGTAPRLWHNNLGSGMSYRPVKSFDVIYIHALHFDDKDETVFYPDDADDSDITMKKWKDVEQVTAYLLLDDMISGAVHTSLGGLATDNWQPTIYE